jgi:hypothetical protein
MDLEQIVKETVAKIVAEKTLTAAEKKKKEDIVMAMKKDFKGPKAAMYAIATDKAKKLAEEYDFVRSAIESASGDKISYTEEDDYGRTIYWSTKNPNVNYFVGMGGEFEGKIYLYNGETGERYPIGDLKHYGDGQNHSADDDMHEAFQPKSSFDDYSIGDNVTVAGKKAKITAMKMDDETGERRARVRFEDDSVKDVNINSLDESKELDKYVIRRWQHYAGIE